MKKNKTALSFYIIFLILLMAAPALAAPALAAPVDNVQLTADPPQGQKAGQDITFTAEVTAGNEEAEFAFWYKVPGGKWVNAKPYSIDNTWTAKTSYTGPAQIGVQARAVGSNVEEARAHINYEIVAAPPVENVALTAYPSEKQMAGKDITFIASVTAGNEDAEFAFWYRLLGRSWKLGRPYSTDRTWEVDTSYIGAVQVGVQTRAVGSSAEEARDWIGYKSVLKETIISNPLKTETVPASDSDQTISYKDQVEVTIPGGLLDNSEELIIGELIKYPSLPASYQQGLESLYAISLGDKKEFSEPIAVKMPYDPDIIPSDWEPHEVLVGMHWDEDRQAWEQVPLEIDKENQHVVIYTDQLSPVGTTVQDRPGRVQNSHFRVIYNNKNTTFERGTWNDQKEMAEDVLEMLDKCREEFNNNMGFRAPGFFSRSWLAGGRTLVFLGNFLESSYSPKSNYLYISNIQFDKDLSAKTYLKHEVAHEYFHAVQNRYYYALGMAARTWWMEATADYAAAGIMGTGYYQPITKTFFENPIYHNPWFARGADDMQKYITAHYINYLVEHKNVDFKDMWGYLSDKYSVFTNISPYLESKTGQTFAESYRDFALYVFYSSGSPTPTRNPYQMGVQRWFPGTASELVEEFQLAKDGTAASLGVQVSMKEDPEKRKLEISLDEDLGDHAYVDIFSIEAGQRLTGQPEPLKTLHSAEDPVLVDVESGHNLYILATNVSGSAKTIEVTITCAEVGLTITPDEIKDVQPDEEYVFTLEADNIREAIENVFFEWDFGDGEEDSSGKSEDIKVTGEGTASTDIEHIFPAGLEECIISAEVKDSATGKTLAETEARIEFARVSVQIEGPRVRTITLDEGVTEKTINFVAAAEPDGTYYFKWDFDDGSAPQREPKGPGEKSTVSKLYSNLEAGSEFRPTVILETEDGTELDRDSILITIAGDDEPDNGDDPPSYLCNLEIGDRVVDPSWEWEHRIGFDYSGTGETKPVTWIVVAKDHYGSGSGVTLLAEDLIGMHAFDNSTDRTVIESENGSGHWGDSGTTNATRGLRPWLNSNGIHSGEGFYRAFSADFKAAIIPVTIPNIEWQTEVAYYTQDRVFVPSSTELGDTEHNNTYEIGTVYPFFSGASDADRIASMGWYWTRSPRLISQDSVISVSWAGSFPRFVLAFYSAGGVRPALNLQCATPVSATPNEDGAYVIGEMEHDPAPDPDPDPGPDPDPDPDPAPDPDPDPEPDPEPDPDPDPALEYTVTFEEKNDLEYWITIYSDVNRTEEVVSGSSSDYGLYNVELESGTYWYTANAALSGFLPYYGSFTVSGAAKTITFELLSSDQPPGQISIKDGEWWGEDNEASSPFDWKGYIELFTKNNIITPSGSTITENAAIYIEFFYFNDRVPFTINNDIAINSEGQFNIQGQTPDGAHSVVISGAFIEPDNPDNQVINGYASHTEHGVRNQSFNWTAIHEDDKIILSTGEVEPHRPIEIEKATTTKQRPLIISDQIITLKGAE